MRGTGSSSDAGAYGWSKKIGLLDGLGPDGGVTAVVGDEGEDEEGEAVSHNCAYIDVNTDGNDYKKKILTAKPCEEGECLDGPFFVTQNTIYQTSCEYQSSHWHTTWRVIPSPLHCPASTKFRSFAAREPETSQRIQRMAGTGASDGSEEVKWMIVQRTDDDHFRDDHRSRGTIDGLIDYNAVTFRPSSNLLHEK